MRTLSQGGVDKREPFLLTENDYEIIKDDIIIINAIKYYFAEDNKN